MKLLPVVAVALTVTAALTLTPALAADPLQDCVDLSAEHVVRRADDSAIAIRDGEQHYRAQMRYACSDLGYSGKLAISTEQHAGRLCPRGSTLTTQRDRCKISRVEAIDAQAFKRYTKR